MSEQDLAILLRTMEPVLHPEPYRGLWGLFSRDGRRGAAASFNRAGMPWARTVWQSDEGSDSGLCTALGAEGISCNVIAGYHHDHSSCRGTGAGMRWRR
jgi:uncharacterized protein